MRSALAISLLAGLSACGGSISPTESAGSGGEEETVAAEPTEGERVIAELERRLREASAVSIAHETTSEGAFTSAISGELELSGSDARWQASGTFADQPVELSLLAHGGDMRGGSAERTFDEPRPPDLRDAIVTVLVRMGLLHDLASLASGEPPERRATHESGWAVVRDAVLDPERDVDGVRAIPIRFRLEVGGEPAGEATLYLHATTRLPLRRELTVHFETGDMHVIERYPRFDVR